MHTQQTFLEHPAQVTREIMPLASKDTAPRLGDIANLPNKWKQSQPKARDKCVPNERQGKTPENELNEMETSNLPDTEFKILFIRMFSELREITDGLRTSTKNQTEMNTLE